MNCQDAKGLLHGYLDGELDLAGNLEIERHLQSCPVCTSAYENQRALRAAIRAGDLSYPLPNHLPKRLQSALRAEMGMDRKTWQWRWTYAAIPAVALALVLLIFFPKLLRPVPANADDQLAQEVVSGHVRSLLADHLTDVPSSDRHTVKPWFSGKLDFSPSVMDLTDQGFTLKGGRLDYLQGRSVAALVYQRRQHIINVFVWPPSPAAAPEKKFTRQGFNLIHWTAGELTWWAISDLNSAELEEFSATLKTQVSAPTPRFATPER